MIIPLIEYSKIKNNCCLGYFGDNKDIINFLQQAKYLIEKELPGINIFIALNDNYIINNTFCIKKSELQDFKSKFAFYKELDEDNSNIIKELLKK